MSTIQESFVVFDTIVSLRSYTAKMSNKVGRNRLILSDVDGNLDLQVMCQCIKLPVRNIRRRGDEDINSLSISVSVN